MKKFFSLMELIIVIVILAILAAIVMLNISDWQMKARESAALANEREVQGAVDRYFLDYGLYPTTPQPTKDNPQLVEWEKIVPDYIRNKPKGDFIVRVDENGKVIIGPGDKDSSPTKPPFTPMTCEEAQAQGFTCIYTPQEFDDIRNNLTGKFILMNDINLSSFTNWVPIGDYYEFKGVLDGNGFKVTNLTINQEAGRWEPLGLFGYAAYGTIKNLQLTDVDITVSGTVDVNIGALVGEVYSDAGYNNPTSENLVVDNVSASGKITYTGSEMPSIGGLIGYVYMQDGDVILKNSSFNGEITSNHSDGASMNGLVGIVYEYAGEFTVDHSSFSGKITSTNDADSDGNGLIGAIYVNSGNGDNLKINITNSAVNNAEITTGDATGLVNGLYIKNVDTEINIQNNKVSGNLSVKGQAMGLFEVFDIDMATYKVAINDIDINVDLHTTMEKSHETVSGFGQYIDLSNTTSDVRISDINISGNIVSENTQNSSNQAFVYGFLEDFGGRYDNSKVVIEDINIGANITSIDTAGASSFPSELTGFIGNYYSVESVINSEIRNITISGNLTGGNVTGFIQDYEPQGGTTISAIDNIKVTGTLKASNTSAGVFNYYAPSDSSITSSIKNVEVSGNLVGYETVGFAHTFEPYSETALANMTVDKFAFTGKMTATSTASGFIQNFSNEWLYNNPYRITGSNHLFQNMRIGGEVAISNGETGMFGGLVTKNHKHTISDMYNFKNSYVSSKVTVSNENAATFKKGLVADDSLGGSSNLAFTNVYWDYQTTGIPASGSPMGEGKSTSDMRKQSTFVNWDFTNTWSIQEGANYPKYK